jgi:hypothetical protein
MNLKTQYRESLIKALENRGWFWRGDFIYAPHKMLWLHKNLEYGVLEEFHGRWSERVQRITRMKSYHDDPQQHQQVVEDNKSLVSALEELLETNNRN